MIGNLAGGVRAAPARSRVAQGSTAQRPRAGRRAGRLVVRAEEQEASPAAEAAPTTSAASPPDSSSSSGGLIAGVSALAGIGLFAATKLSAGGAATLATLEAASVPLDVALSNGSPTVVEFYADWCKVCNEMAPMTYEVESTYKDKVNFVMLNIDNSKWSDEMAKFGVPGIPEFVFLNPQGEPEAIAWGKLPEEVLKSDVAALAQGEELPYARVKRGEQASPLSTAQMIAAERAAQAPAPRQVSPLDHS
ncbi:unnamed protein product [Pedinophyceae sp. YPF-701]|nr:unnamed protein product [Pedinophyceae sp. YPF-701]